MSATPNSLANKNILDAVELPLSLVLLLAAGAGLAVASLYYCQPMLGILGEEGLPVKEMGILQTPALHPAHGGEQARVVMTGAICKECGNATVIRKDGCDFCTACGAVGACG